MSFFNGRGMSAGTVKRAPMKRTKADSMTHTPK